MTFRHSTDLPWSHSAEDKQRFQRVVVPILTLTLLLGVAIPMLPIIEKKPLVEPPKPVAIAKLIFEMPKKKVVKKVIKPKPKVVKAKKKPVKKIKRIITKKPRPAPKPTVAKKKVIKPKVDRVAAARKKAASSGLLALQDSLAELRNHKVDRVNGAQRLTNSGRTARKTERSIITSATAKQSQGIQTSRMSRDAGSTTLAARTATEVQAPETFSGSAAHTAGGSNQVPSRSTEEIQIVFDHNKSAIYSIYNRALRKDPSLQGKLILELTIAPSGAVTSIALISSELAQPILEKKLLTRIKMFDFGSKSVEAVTITYPIDFLPA